MCSYFGGHDSIISTAMDSTRGSPRYMALNSGQEAFQLFYERLLQLVQMNGVPKDVQSSFFRNNRTHLSTIIHTFNRHYCTEVGTNNEFHGIDGKITPVFLNLGLYEDPKYNLHRLLGVHMKFGKSPVEDTIVFTFDHPAFDADSPSVGLPEETSYTVFDLPISVFASTYYKEHIYRYDTTDHEKLNLLYDKETMNFKYATPVLDRILTHIDCDRYTPPLYGDLQIMNYTEGGTTLSCIDKKGVYQLLGQKKNTFSPAYYWTVNVAYIAHNRYVTTDVIKIEYVAPTILHDNNESRRLLTLLFGCNDMLYVSANFRLLQYKPVLYLKTNNGDTTLLKGPNLLKIWKEAVGYNEPEAMDAPINPVISYKTEDTKNQIQAYINAYHRLNNLINCKDTTLDTVRHMLYGNNEWTTKETNKLVEIDRLISGESYGDRMLDRSPVNYDATIRVMMESITDTSNVIRQMTNAIQRLQ